MIDFEKGKISNINKLIINSFNRLPADINEKSQGRYFRYRKFSRLILFNKKFLPVKDTNFYQKRKINRFAGGKVRKFKAIDSKVLNGFAHIFEKNFFEKNNYEKNGNWFPSTENKMW